MKYHILRADPTGNITVFVLDPVPEEERTALASKIMNIEWLKADQVGFVCAPEEGLDGHLEMMGGEFCGNATRALGMLIAQERAGKKAGLSGILAAQGYKVAPGPSIKEPEFGSAPISLINEAKEPEHLLLKVSGMDHPVHVDVDLDGNYAAAEMPLPKKGESVTIFGKEYPLVHVGDMAHIVAEQVVPSKDFFTIAESELRRIPDIRAYGVIFLDPVGNRAIPLVKVRATDTLIWEGSCVSGALACAAYQSRNVVNGAFEREYIQPAGTLKVSVERKLGEVTGVSIESGTHAKVAGAMIGGPVSLGDVTEIEL